MAAWKAASPTFNRKGGQKVTRQRILLALLLAIVVTIDDGIGRSASAASSEILTIAAANSLKQALRHILPLFEAQYKTVDVRVVYGPSQTLRKQIEQGAPVDIFLPSSVEEIDKLEKQGLIIKGTKQFYAETRLVLITGTLLPAKVASLQDVTKPEIRRIAVGDTKTYSVGQFAIELFQNLHLDQQVGSRYVYAEHSTAVLDLVAKGEAEVGVVYRTDAAQSSKVRIVAEAPPGSHSPVHYGVAIVWTANKVALARTFSEFLLTPVVQHVLQEDGFDRAHPRSGRLDNSRDTEDR